MKDRILAAAVKLAEKMPLHSVTRGEIANKVKCAPSLVTWYLGNAAEIRSAVVARAVETNNAEIIAWAIAARHPKADHVAVPVKLRREALRILATEAAE